MVNLKANNQLAVSIALVDQFGNPNAQITSIPEYSLSDDDMGTISPDPSGTIATFTPSGLLGAVTITVSAESAIGGGTTIEGHLSVNVTPGDAAQLNVNSN